MSLAHKIFADVGKVVEFLQQNLVTDGDENLPNALVITVQPASLQCPEKRYAFSLSKLKMLTTMQHFVEAVHRTIGLDTALAANEKDVVLSYQVTFENGSAKVLWPFDEIARIADLHSMLRQCIHDEMAKLSEKLVSLVPCIKARSDHYWRVAIEVPRIQQRKHQYWFNYNLTKFFPENSNPLEYTAQLSNFESLVLKQIVEFLRLLEVRDSSCLSLIFDVPAIKAIDMLYLPQNDLGIGLADFPSPVPEIGAKACDTYQVIPLSVVQDAVAKESPQEIELSSKMEASVMRRDFQTEGGVITAREMTHTNAGIYFFSPANQEDVLDQKPENVLSISGCIHHK